MCWHLRIACPTAYTTLTHVHIEQQEIYLLCTWIENGEEVRLISRWKGGNLSEHEIRGREDQSKTRITLNESRIQKTILGENSKEHRNDATKRRIVRMVDMPDLKAFKFSLKCLNWTPRVMFRKEKVGGEANNTGWIENSEWGST